MSTPIHQAIKFAGSQAKLAGLAGCSQQAIAKLAIGKSKRPSAELAVAIHRATKGVVTVHDLRPDIFGPAIPADRPIPSSFRSETKAPLPPTDLETPPERPPVIPDEEWAKLSPSGRALIETAYRSIADQALSEAQVLAITQLILSTSDRNRK